MTAERDRSSFEWGSAFYEAEQGKMTWLRHLIRERGVPPFATERLDRLLAKVTLKVTTAPKRTPHAVALADAFVDWHRYVDEDGRSDREATILVCQNYGIEENVLNNVLALNRPDVNPILRERGLLKRKG
jgi:hypothetical protein